MPTVKNRSARLWPMLMVAFALAFIGVVLAGFKANTPPGNPPHVFASPVRMVPGTDSNTLLVSDLNAHQVHFINRKTLDSKASINLAGRPSGVAQLKKHVVIANYDNGSVCVYSNTGVFSHCLGSGPGEFQQPNDLAIDPSGTFVYVLDTRAKRVMAYDLDSGSPTETHFGVGQLIQPTALALSPLGGALYVSDFGDASTVPQIQIFTADGSYDHSILGGKNRFSTPQGLHIDAAGRVFLADAVSGEVVIFDASGVRVGALGGLGVAEGKLFYPLDVYVDYKSQDVYVADNRNHRITVFRKGGVLP